MAKTRGQRFLIMVMGSIMNIVLAVVIVAFMNGVGTSAASTSTTRRSSAGSRPARRPRGPGCRSTTRSSASPAARSRPGRTSRWPSARKPDRLDPRSRSAGTARRSRVDLQDGIGDPVPDGLRRLPGEDPDPGPDGPAQVAGGEGRPAGRGRHPGHRRDARSTSTSSSRSIQKNPGKELLFTVDRGGRAADPARNARAKRARSARSASPRSPNRSSRNTASSRPSAQSFKENQRNVFLVIRFIKDLFTGEASTRQLGGPLEIANFSYAAFRMGWMALLAWIAVHQPPARRPQPLPHPGLRRRPDLRPDHRSHLPPGPRAQGPAGLDVRSASSSSSS